MDMTYAVPYLGDVVKLNTAEEILTVSVPGSKSITNRVFLLAALAKGNSTIKGALFSDDTLAFLNCLQSLGFQVSCDEAGDTVIISGNEGKIPSASASLNVESAGTAARFLTALLSVQEGTYHMYSSPQMQKRPMDPLLAASMQLGAKIYYKNAENSGHFPFTIEGHGWATDNVTVNISSSGQYLSALLIASCFSPKDFTIKTVGNHGLSYIEMTRKIMEQFGVKNKKVTASTYVTPAKQCYKGREYTVEPDVSSACYFYAMCPLLQIPVRVRNVHKDSMQGDLAFLDVLAQMGCRYEDTPNGIVVYPPEDGHLKAVDVDMSSFSDQAITLAALAPFADGVTTIRGIGHIRYQECDRIRGISTELTKMGILCEEGTDRISIHSGMPLASTVETYNDHRMAMGFSLIGLRVPGIIISNPACCSKTFAEYFNTLDTITGQLLN